jgi:hypothetical protein
VCVGAVRVESDAEVNCSSVAHGSFSVSRALNLGRLSVWLSLEVCRVER